MRLARGLLGSLLWIVAALLGLVAVILCVTVILLPVGIPLLSLARRMFGKAVTLMLPRTVTHPVEELRKSARGTSAEAGKALRGRGRKAVSEAAAVGDAASETARRARRLMSRQRRRLG